MLIVFWHILTVVFISLVFLLPLSIALFYFSLAFKQWRVGVRENSFLKKKGGLWLMIPTLGAILAIVWLWWYVIQNTF